MTRVAESPPIVRDAELRETPSVEQMMGMPAVGRRWTAHEVRALIEESPLASPRYELVDGELLVTPSPGFLHQRAVTRLVEVLSPSSSRHDRVRKRPLYQRHVPEYWIVDLDARLIERWGTGDSRAEPVTTSLEWLPEGATSPFVLDVERFFAEVFAER